MFPQKDLSETQETLKSFFDCFKSDFLCFVSYWNTNIYLIALFDSQSQNPFFLFFDKYGEWHTDYTDTTDF